MKLVYILMVSHAVGPVLCHPQCTPTPGQWSPASAESVFVDLDACKAAAKLVIFQEFGDPHAAYCKPLVVP